MKTAGAETISQVIAQVAVEAAKAMIMAVNVAEKSTPYTREPI